MFTYENVKNKSKLFRTLTGLDPEEFEKLLVAFRAAWVEFVEQRYNENEERQRKPGGGRKPILDTMENKLLFILFYFKTYPLQEVIAFLFGMGQSQACEWIHTLSTVLKIALAHMQHLPERNPKQLEVLLAEDPENEFAIDATERRRQRPKDNIEQREYYSGKKKAHTVKNDVIVTLKARTVKYLSNTYKGKTHDKKICDEEQPTFPEACTLYQDTGFQGYAPEGVIIQQPKKKPRDRELSVEEKKQNALISSVRIVAEHVIAGIKRCRIVKDVFRNTKPGFDDSVMVVACGLHNFRTACRAPG
jgi:hypothetical protein